MPAGWAEWDVEGLLAVAFADGFCQLTNSPGGVGLRGIYRTCPPEAEWSIWSKVNLSGIAAAQFSCGIFVAEDIAVNPTTAKIAWALIAVTSVSATVLNRGTGTDYNGPFVNQVNLAYGPWGYVRIGYDGTNFTFWGSNSGLEWVSIGPVLAKTFTPSHAGICVLNISPGPAYHYIDFYRVKAGAGASGPGAGLFRGRRL